MGKKGASGGGQQAPQVGIPSGLYQTIASTSGLGQYASGLLDSLGSMTNWAANIASAGNAGNIPGFASTAIQAGPQVNFGGAGAGGSNLWNSSFDPTTGLVTFTNTHAPQQTFTENIQGGQLGDLPQQIKQQWTDAFQQHQQGSAGGISSQATPATAGQISAGVSLPEWQQWYGQNQGKTIYVNGKQQTIGSNISPDALLSAFRNGQVSWGSPDMNTALGPFLGSAWNAIQTQETLPSQMKSVEQQTTDLANEAAAEGKTLMTEATTGTGLFPSQSAYVEQTRQQGITEEESMLAKLGLSQSTMEPQLKEQANLAADATAGQLVQGNIALAQASQKIAVGAQALETSEQQAVFDMYSAIAAEGEGFQKQMWEEALSGYGALGQIISTSAQSYGLNIEGYKTALSALETNAQNQTALDEAAMKADSQGTSSMFGALGSIFGGGGGGGGGGSSAGSSIGSIIGAVVGIVGSIFCWVAREVYGTQNPRWLEFRHWMLTKAPDWLFQLYGEHGERFAAWVSDKPPVKLALRLLMDMILAYA